MNTKPMETTLSTTMSEQDPVRPSTSGGSKAKRNLWVDIATAIAFAAMLSTGIVLEWVLPPGRFGGRGLTWLGLDRHGWGDVHFWLAFVLIGLIVTHVVLHWTWVKTCWSRWVGTTRSVWTWVAVGLLALVVALPLLIPRAYTPGVRGPGPGRGVEWQAGSRMQNVPAGQRVTGRGQGLGRGLRHRGTARTTEDAPVDDPNWGMELWEGDFGP